MSTLNGGPGIITDGLVLYLDAANPYSYVSGSTVWNDLSRSQVSGSLINGPTFNTGSGGNIVFDGTDDYVIGDILTFDDTAQGHTLNIWVKLGNLTREQHFINLKGNQSSGTQFYIVTNRLGTSAYGNLQGYLGQFQTNVWYMITQTRTSGITGSAAHYVNGIEVASGTLPTCGTAVQYVLGNYVGLGNYYLSGSIAIGQIYNRSLLAAEVLQNYNSQKSRFGL